MEADNMQAVIDAARQGVSIEKTMTTIEGIPVLVESDGVLVHVLTNVLEAADARADSPRRRKGTSKHTELGSFIEHVNRFKDADSAIFADADAVTLTAVLDYHHAGAASDPRWGQHRSVYTCPLSEQWKTWNAQSGVKMTQDAFADFLDANQPDLAAPPDDSKSYPMPADVLTMARNLVVRSKGTFERSLNPTTGEASLVCKNEHDTSSTKIPRAFLIGIPVFEAGAAYSIEALIRMEMREGRPVFSFTLNQPQVVKRHAFAEVRAAVKAQTSLPLFVGSPE